MTPLEWIKSKDTTCAELAREWGVSTTSVWRPVTGRDEVSYYMIAKFFTASGGRVGIKDWITLRPPKERGKK